MKREERVALPPRKRYLVVLRTMQMCLSWQVSMVQGHQTAETTGRRSWRCMEHEREWRLLLVGAGGKKLLKGSQYAKGR